MCWRDHQRSKGRRQTYRDEASNPQDLAREYAEGREASVGEEPDQKEQVVDIRGYERAGRQQDERQKVHAAAGFW